MPDTSDGLHFPRSAPIEAYGKGGFAFADMSHRGSLLCLPDSIRAWPVTMPEQIDRYSLAKVFEQANAIDTLIIGSGADVWLPPRELREELRITRRKVEEHRPRRVTLRAEEVAVERVEAPAAKTARGTKR